MENLFTHGAPRSSKDSFRTGRAFQDRIGIWKCWCLRRGETQPTYDAGSGDSNPGGEWLKANALTTAPNLLSTAITREIFIMARNVFQHDRPHDMLLK